MDFTQIWTWVASILAGLSVVGIGTAIIYGAIRGYIKKLIGKTSIKAVCTETIKETHKGMKAYTFTHNIQPVLESGLEKVNEKSAEFINTKTKQLEERYDKLLKVVEKLSAYFDNSIAVSDQAKAELKEAIAEAKEDKPIEVVEDVVTFEVEEEAPKEDKKQEKQEAKVIR